MRRWSMPGRCAGEADSADISLNEEVNGEASRVLAQVRQHLLELRCVAPPPAAVCVGWYRRGRQGRQNGPSSCSMAATLPAPELAEAAPALLRQLLL